MGVYRRDFLKFLGLSAVVAAGAAPAIDVLAGGDEQTSAPRETLSKASKNRWAMVVIASKLTEEDCHAAVEACHRTHNVPNVVTKDGAKDIKHEIKWIWTDHFHHVFPEQAGEFLDENTESSEFLVLCNHCTDPPCCRVCPTQATFKRESDGIVIMDMHRCIGCRFCMAGCPYGSRSFNFFDPRRWLQEKEMNPEFPTRMKGVVEKCNFCAERLFKGQYPACVEACTNGGLVFGDLNDPGSEVRRLLREHHAIQRKPSLGTGPNVYYII